MPKKGENDESNPLEPHVPPKVKDPIETEAPGGPHTPGEKEKRKKKKKSKKKSKKLSRHRDDKRGRS